MRQYFPRQVNLIIHPTTVLWGLLFWRLILSVYFASSFIFIPVTAKNQDEWDDMANNIIKWIGGKFADDTLYSKQIEPMIRNLARHIVCKHLFGHRDSHIREEMSQEMTTHGSAALLRYDASKTDSRKSSTRGIINYLYATMKFYMLKKASYLQRKKRSTLQMVEIAAFEEWEDTFAAETAYSVDADLRERIEEFIAYWEDNIDGHFKPSQHRYVVVSEILELLRHPHLTSCPEDFTVKNLAAKYGMSRQSMYNLFRTMSEKYPAA